MFVYRIPAIWGAAVNADMAGAYYALKALGVADALDGKMFEAVRGGRFRSWTVEEFVAFATANRITSIPTLMVIRDGVVLFNQAGALPEPELRKLVSAVQDIDMTEVHAKIAEEQAKQS